MKSISHRHLLIVCLFLLTLSTATQAETLYIDDVVFVPLRSGPSAKHRILHKGLKSGTVLTVISEEDSNGFVNVETKGGLSGWLPKHYLTKTPTAALRLAENTSSLNKAVTAKNTLEKNNSEIKDALSKTKAALSNVEKEKQQLSIELHKIRSISSGAIELDKKYQKLLENHELLQISNDSLNAENANLKNDRRFGYMFYGATLVILGMFLAVIIPHLKVKKRHSEWVN